MPNLEKGNSGLNEDEKRFYKLVDEAGLELYLNCTTGFFRLSFIIRLYHLKCLDGWNNTYFTSLLELLEEAIPNLNIFTSFNKTKNIVKDLDLDYERIDRLGYGHGFNKRVTIEQAMVTVFTRDHGKKMWPKMPEFEHYNCVHRLKKP
ncbi:hypothetical protein AHAS_Ahas07G0138800 [Arachis hypogaea]